MYREGIYRGVYPPGCTGRHITGVYLPWVYREAYTRVYHTQGGRETYTRVYHPRVVGRHIPVSLLVRDTVPG